MSGLSRLLLTSLSVQCEVRVRHGMPKGQRFQYAGGPRRSDLVETLDSYVSSPFAMGIISKSVAHACSGGARGFFKPNDQEYGEAAGVVKFHRDQEKPGRYVSEFRGPARVSCKHAHRAAQPRKAAQLCLMTSCFLRDSASEKY